MDKQYIQTLIEEKLQTTGYELITLKISAQNEILVEVDKLEGVDVEFCAELNHYLVEQIDAQGIDDYSLEVGSVSITDPFKTQMQYQKHLNHDVEVLAADGKKYRGVLVTFLYIAISFLLILCYLFLFPSRFLRFFYDW